MGKIKNKIKKGKDKVVEWTKENGDVLALTAASVLMGALTCVSGFILGVSSGYDVGHKNGRKIGQQEGVAVTEAFIRNKCPEAAKTIDKILDEIE